ncbi:MAG: RNA polymerase sigma factor [Deltaproteobacteria bacterium]|nr:RNA polymerase sigma factor [Deltaproteobacteria bacterium]
MKLETQEKSDEALMADVANGDSVALGQLYVRHNNAVRAMIGYVIPGMARHDVDDVIQDVFLSLGKAAKNYRHQSRFNAFLFRIATNRARDWQRRAGVRWLFFCGAPEVETAAPAQHTQTTPSQHTELSQTVRQVMNSLSWSHREVLVLNVVAGFTCEEIAAILNIRPKTVRTRMHRARNAVLQHRLAPVWQAAISEKSP